VWVGIQHMRTKQERNASLLAEPDSAGQPEELVVAALSVQQSPAPAGSAPGGGGGGGLSQLALAVGTLGTAGPPDQTGARRPCCRRCSSWHPCLRRWLHWRRIGCIMIVVAALAGIVAAAAFAAESLELAKERPGAAMDPCLIHIGPSAHAHVTVNVSDDSIDRCGSQLVDAAGADVVPSLEVYVSINYQQIPHDSVTVSNKRSILNGTLDVGWDSDAWLRCQFKDHPQCSDQREDERSRAITMGPYTFKRGSVKK
jgi:hypothetical protein